MRNREIEGDNDLLAYGRNSRRRESEFDSEDIKRYGIEYLEDVDPDYGRDQKGGIMNKEETIDCMKVMQAFVDGETIQYTFGIGPFETTTSPDWQWSSIRYRKLNEPNENNDPVSIEETKKYLEIMQAFVDGKQIQYKSTIGKLWKPTDVPAWRFNTYEYRVAKEIPDFPEKWRYAQHVYDGYYEEEIMEKQNEIIDYLDYLRKRIGGEIK